MRQNGGFFSDEAGYFPIIQSLAYDFDIKYERRDLLRIQSYFPSGPDGMFLKRGKDDRLFFAKSFAYPLVVAPFFRLLGVNGILLVNGLMIYFIILMAYLLLKQHHPEPGSFSFALIFVLASVTPVYIWWMTADLFNFFVMFGGLFFFFYRFRRPWMFYIAALFFSFAVFSKPWNAAAVGIVYLILIYRKQWKKFVLLSLASVFIFSIFVGFMASQTGELTYKLFQGGERRTFYKDFPYATKEDPIEVFKRGTNMSFDGYWDRLHLSPKIIVANLYYFFFGRFTGIFIYFFPACFLLIVFFFQEKVPEDWFIFAAITVAILIFTILAADNYFGGSGSVGNRYFFNIFPLFFFLGFRKRMFRFTVVPIIMAAIFLPGVFMDSHWNSIYPRMAGLSFPARLFPPEKTQYLSLPTNENPRAFGKPIHDRDKTFQAYFINNNFHEVHKSVFWTRKNYWTELFVATPWPVKNFRITLRSEVPDNPVTLMVEYKRKHAVIKANKHYVVNVDNITGLRIKDKYVYYIKVKSDNYWGGYRPDNNTGDKRELGVEVRLGVDYHDDVEHLEHNARAFLNSRAILNSQTILNYYIGRPLKSSYGSKVEK